MSSVFYDINFFSPNTNEFLFEFIYLLGYSDTDLNSPEKEKIIKQEVLKVIKKLMELDVLNVKSWYERPEMSKKSMTIKETIKEIDNIWFEGAKYPDFYNMVLFGAPAWYSRGLKELGLSMTTDWATFVADKIGNLEKWIIENRPKKEPDHG